MSKDYTRVFEEGLQQGQANAQNSDSIPVDAIQEEDTAEQAVPEEAKSDIQILFGIVSENPASSDFNVADYNEKQNGVEGIVVEPIEYCIDENGQEFMPYIAVQSSLDDDDKNSGFSMTVKTEHGEASIDDASFDQALTKIGEFIGHYMP